MSRRIRRPRFTYTASGIVGLALLALVVLVALVGPFIAPHDPNAPIGLPGAGPSGAALLGTDEIGRDVLSRVLYGGRSVIALGTAATVLSYVAGVAIGLVAGSVRTVVDPLLMRAVDVMLSFPSLVLLLLFIASVGSSIPTLIFGVVLLQAPAIARLTRTATLEVSTRGHVEAAEARGDRRSSILIREILPNIAPTVLASFGLGFGSSIIVLASVNYLGLGLTPPASDWGLMVANNQAMISSNPWSVLGPALMIILLILSVNLITDAYWQTLGRSRKRTQKTAGPERPVNLPGSGPSAALTPDGVLRAPKAFN
jgi:ABC-type dipeptide/oligopeptide/nickel transport system permease subunit